MKQGWMKGEDKEIDCILKYLGIEGLSKGVPSPIISDWKKKKSLWEENLKKKIQHQFQQKVFHGLLI